MKYLKSTISILLGLLLSGSYMMVGVKAQEPAASNSATSQSANTLERGYRTGYSDGYQAGLRDMTEGIARDFRNKNEYRNGDRAYVGTYGSLEDYRDGYQQGFEAGYNAGFDQRSFDSKTPAGLMRRGSTDTPTSSTTQSGSSASTNVPDTSTSGSSSSSSVGSVNSGTLLIPGNTVMRVELLNNLSTNVSQQGDRFQARVMEPREYQGATLDGRVTRVKRPGRGRGAAELQLSVESIHLADGRSARLSAQVIEVITPGESGVRDVDPEGGVRGRSSTKDDVAKIGAGAGIGAIIGAIAGGGAGAAIGAAIGGGVSTGGVLASRGKDIRLSHGQQLRIRTATETRF